ncbi:MAG: putative toxin-antitoxin system toxin component, PIN family [Candidatus Eisenbacteria sp.]|nr:putative toxin-antitoxin system toxin component, PIN family [Candidatus Eisenbacteria bacterium]
MRVVLDTNVLISGAFYSGPPLQILQACMGGEFQLALSPQILLEYRRVGQEFSQKRSSTDFERLLGLLVAQALIVEVPDLARPVSRDRQDDKFIACALAVGGEVIVSGDKDLLTISEQLITPVLRPREFVDRYIGEGS